MSATRVTRRTTGNRTESAGLVAPTGAVLAPTETEPTSLDILAEAAAVAETESDSTGTRTRSGRVSKPPVRYEPVEQVEDDYDADDYDTEDPDDVSEEIETESDEEEDESDADDDGNLDGFVVADKSESDYSSSDDGEPPLPQAIKRTPVKKRPAATPRK
jgi:hypothetical protein